ncbi:hypothetical protein [Streptomyces sp. NEAU-174]|uniref:hypothetical protein n=1 Tax=Streptomyces sp. NEAU-174 TaxID=3458254 RepID=UPI0040445835
MATIRAVIAAPAHYVSGAAAAAVIAPLAGSGHADALAHRGRDAVAVTLDASVRPPAHHDVAIDEAYTAIIEHSRDLRRTIKRLRSYGVDAVMAGSPLGIELAERIAWQLGLPGSGIPGSTPLRMDRGAQAEALRQKGVAAPRTLRTSNVAEALAWADFDQTPVYQLTSATIDVPTRPVNCRTRQEIAAAWNQAQDTAYRRSGDHSLVLRELVSGRRYKVDSLTWLGPEGPQHTVTGIWAHTHTPAGLLDRADLLRRQGLLARRLSVYVGSVLDTLGVISGPISCRVAFEAERGPVLLSAGVVTHRSRADEAVWEVTGRDPIDAALGSVQTVFPRTIGSRVHHVARIYLKSLHGGAPVPGLRQTLAALPTVACMDACPSGGKSRCPGEEEACEIVLTHEEPEAIERDYRYIRALTADPGWDRAR